MREVVERPDDEDYPVEHSFDGASGCCTVKSMWVDVNGSFWLESVDGQRVVVLPEVRRLVAKRVREATFR